MTASRGVDEARRLLDPKKRRPPRDDDRPPVSTWPGRKPKILPGQLDLAGREVVPLDEWEGDEAA